MPDKIFIKNLLIFSAIFLIVLLVSFSLLSFLGLLPGELRNEFNTGDSNKNVSLSDEIPNEEMRTVKEKGEMPYRLVAPSINLDTSVIRPPTTNYSDLNNALTQGAVYYPGSGTAGSGNMFIFGHSTSFTYVNNKAYQIFNNVKNLKSGDEIKVYGQSKVYIYKVRDVEIVDATKELIDFSDNKTMLTLSTCDSFGKKTDRYVAEAYFVTFYSI